MKNIVFKSENGLCPYFNHNGNQYYLYEGKPVGYYQWCLMVKSLNVETKTFSSKLELSNWLRNENLTKEEFDRLTKELGENWWYKNYIYKYRDYNSSASLEANGKNWCFEKKELTLTEIAKVEQLTGWGTYNETLQFAKEYLKELMEKEDITLF